MPIKILRALLIGLLLVVIGIPVTAYIMLSTDWAQQRLTATAEEALHLLLGTEAKVERVGYAPFNRLKIKQVTVCDDYGRECLSIGELQVRMELAELLLHRKLIIDYVVVDSPEVTLSRPEPGAPLNISGIISRFKKGPQKKESSKFTLRLNDLEVEHGRLVYSVLSADTLQGRFDPNHVELTNIAVGLHAPKLSPTGFEVQVSRLSAMERSGLCITNLTANVAVSDAALSVSGLAIELPQSRLEFGPVTAPLSSFSDISKIGTELPVSAEIASGSHIYLPALAPLAPVLGNADVDAEITLLASGTLGSISLQSLKIGCDAATVTASAIATGLPTPDSLMLTDVKVTARANSVRAASMLRSLGVKPTATLEKVLARAGQVSVGATYDGSLSRGHATAKISTDCGGATLSGNFSRYGSAINCRAKAALAAFNPGQLLQIPDLGAVSGTFETDGTLSRGKYLGKVSGEIQSAEYKQYTYRDVDFEALASATETRVEVESADPNLDFSLIASVVKAEGSPDSYAAGIDLRRANLHALNLTDKLENYNLSAEVSAKAQAISLAQFKGKVEIDHLHYVDSMFTGLRMKSFVVDADCLQPFQEINITSDYLNGALQGRFNLATLGAAAKRIAAQALPQLIYGVDDPNTPVSYDAYDASDDSDDSDPSDDSDDSPEYDNDFTFNLTVDNAENPCNFFKLPVSILDPVEITGYLSDRTGSMLLNLDAEWLMQGDNLIEDTYLTAAVDGETGIMHVYATTHYPTKKGPMNLLAHVSGENGVLDTDIDWQLERDIPINGKIVFSTKLGRDSENKVTVNVNIEPGRINFGNALWEIMPASIFYSDKSLMVNDFALMAPTQTIRASGHVTDQPADVLTLSLSNIELQEIFETLEIDKAMLCGSATGEIAVSQLFTKAPSIESTTFKVRGIGYNRCVLGDADIRLGLDNESRAFWFDADVAQEGGHKSSIVGSIVPATEELDIQFVADHVRVGFMQPFMEAFCSGIEGYASGQAHLFGTFKYIDLAAENLVADSLKLKIDFTNTWYTTRMAPISITPGSIKLKNITLYDDYGHTAKLTGTVEHEFFKRPTFNFKIEKARNFLCYDMPKGANDRWWGTVFGTGSAEVIGRPGMVDINVDMTTQPNSKFTFALTDAEVAEEYSFITFRDVSPVVSATEYYDMKVESASVNRAKGLTKNEENDAPTAFNMNIHVGITPDALVTLVMDPVSGDEIRAYGTGDMRMYYGSLSDQLTLNGRYELERGNYNFTLQDIIIREFQIRRGSTIQFDGDPFKAALNIDAVFQTNANLSDLDESFLSDKDLNRTNVPVYAVLKVTGQMMQPDITFDLEFPTLTDDVSRKVHSIISTEDMMNRQIIYLLALNRFYTPDYMSTTKGNELFSVASSTISSQLSSMLGKLSENWSIAPNLRSDRGDFSDVEVDVNLSSRLLNNRLLFNGNFGYRDKSLNTNQFVGDFDIEYLINRSGTFRLKAYNRYNDQNYYLRTAQTTQGVGVVIRRDFDSLSDLLRRKKHQPAPATEVPADSLILISPTDSIK